LVRLWPEKELKRWCTTIAFLFVIFVLKLNPMTHLDINDYFPIGYIVKPHGLKGEMVIEVEEGFEEILSESEYLLVEVEGGLVPFFVSKEGLHFRTATTFSVTFEDSDSAEKVRPLCGCKIYLDKNVDQEQPDLEEFNELIGFTVFDTEKGELGKISRVDDFSGNVVLTIMHRNAEILIPLSEDLLAELNRESKEIHLNCPDGLIDLYLE
jgi:16S rRNA processing protein RimM